MSDVVELFIPCKGIVHGLQCPTAAVIQESSTHALSRLDHG